MPNEIDAVTAALIEQAPIPDRLDVKQARLQSMSNIRHRWLDYGVGSMIYFMSSVMHFKQQSNAATALGLWASGSFLFINGGLRTVDGPSRAITQGEAASCWLWLLSSVGMYRQHGVFKYCGMSSCFAAAATCYYTVRWGSEVMSGED